MKKLGITDNYVEKLLKNLYTRDNNIKINFKEINFMDADWNELFADSFILKKINRSSPMNRLRKLRLKLEGSCVIIRYGRNDDVIIRNLPDSIFN
jgi:hypothetical protein